MTGPIRPQDVAAAQASNIPQEVLDVINNLIARNASGSGTTITAVVLQRDIVAMLVDQGIVTSNDDANTRGYLDFEEAYRAQGWEVEYDKPGFNETYPAKFIFRGSRQ